MVSVFRGRSEQSSVGTTTHAPPAPVAVEPPSRHFPAAAVPRPRPSRAPEPGPLEVETCVVDGVITVVVIGELLQETADVFSAVSDRALAGTADVRGVRVDLRPTTFMDSTGLGRLVSLRHRLSAADTALTLVKPDERVFRLFEITHLDTVFEFEAPPAA